MKVQWDSAWQSKVMLKENLLIVDNYKGQVSVWFKRYVSECNTVLQGNTSLKEELKYDFGHPEDDLG